MLADGCIPLGIDLYRQLRRHYKLIGNVNTFALDVNSDAVATAVYTFAFDTSSLPDRAPAPLSADGSAIRQTPLPAAVAVYMATSALRRISFASSLIAAEGTAQKAIRSQGLSLRPPQGRCYRRAAAGGTPRTASPARR
jgi:hypothetical protein